MLEAPVGNKETQRLEALQSYDVLDTSAEADFDGLTFLAKQICDVPIALISFVDADRQWFKSKVGLDVDETPRKVSFCGHAIHAEDDVFIVPDALADDRFKDNPMVVGDPHIRSYAGAVLRSTEGHGLGTLCVLDTQAKNLDVDQIAALATLARQSVALLNLRRTLDETAKAADEKSLFFAKLNHELRTPLNGVLGMSEVLRETPLTEDQGAMLGTVQDSARTLLRLVDNILDLTRLDSSEFELSNEAFDPTAAAEAVSRMLDPTAAEAGVYLFLYTDPTLADFYEGDEGRVRQILINLCHNAIKFCSKTSKKGRVEVSVVAVGDKGLKLVVQDNGIGMKESTKQRLFDPFAQASVGISRRYGGQGLGMAITMDLVKRMQGEIAIDSAPGTGAVFEVFLPLRRLDDHAPVSRKKISDRNLVNLSCGVIGEDSLMNTAFSRYLECVGARVTRLKNIDSAVRWRKSCKNQELHVLVIDAGENHLSQDDVNQISLDLGGHDRLLLVAIERGKRRSIRRVGDNAFTIDGNALGREAFLHAVATAAGKVQARSEDAQQKVNCESSQRTMTRADAVARNRLILVAEDNSTNREVLRAQLALANLVGDICSDGVQACEHLRTTNYALVLTDLDMPGMTGYELAQHIRNLDNASADVPIIALTANALPEEKRKCLKNGFNDYLSKPVSTNTLNSTILKWLPEEETTQDLDSNKNGASPNINDSLHDNNSAVDEIHTADSFSDISENPPVDIAALVDLVGDDETIVASLLRDFVESASDAAAALISACDSGDFSEVRRQAHKLKSSARAVGALQLGLICEQVEKCANSEDDLVVLELMPPFRAAVDAAIKFIEISLDKG